jgi:hypothetical protein
LDAKIKKEIYANERSTVWSDRKVRFGNCIGQKLSVKCSNMWEEYYAVFKGHDGMLATGIKLSRGPSGLDAVIEEEIEEKEGSTLWSDRKVRLANCNALKSIVKHSNKWEENYTEFKADDRMPAIGTK